MVSFGLIEGIRVVLFESLKANPRKGVYCLVGETGLGDCCFLVAWAVIICYSD